MSLLQIQIHKNGFTPRPEKILLPVVPRVGEIVTLPDNHWRVTNVSHQNHPDVPEGYPDTMRYTIRVYVELAYPEVEQ